MEKYSNISENAKLAINSVSHSLQSVSEHYKEQIKGLTKEEANLIALEYIEELHAILSMDRMQEDIRNRKDKKNTQHDVVSTVDLISASINLPYNEYYNKFINAESSGLKNVCQCCGNNTIDYLQTKCKNCGTEHKYIKK